MKNFVVLSLALLAVFACSVNGQSHNVTWGVIGPYDRLLDRDIITTKYKPLQIVTEDFKFPKPGNYNNYNITGIRCTDQYINGNGGYATLLQGGVGNKNVTIHLKSQRGHGYNFIVEIYGR